MRPPPVPHAFSLLIVRIVDLLRVKVSDPRDTKALFSSLLAFVRVPIFAEQAVQGISSCIGGKSQDLVSPMAVFNASLADPSPQSQIALGALLPLVGPAKPAETAAVFSALANIADANHRINRVFVPVVNTAFELLQSGIVSQGSEAGTVSRFVLASLHLPIL